MFWSYLFLGLLSRNPHEYINRTDTIRSRGDKWVERLVRSIRENEARERLGLVKTRVQARTEQADSVGELSGLGSQSK